MLIASHYVKIPEIGKGCGDLRHISRSAKGSRSDEEVFDDLGLDQRCSVRTPRREVVAGNISERGRCLMTWD
jgi:hypothetical protein